MKQDRQPYVKPSCEVVEIELQQMMVSSITGTTPDSDDTEFGILY